MAQGQGGNGKVSLGPPPGIPPGGDDPALEARVARLEAAVDRLQMDVSEVRTVVGRLEPKISEMAGAFPHLATKAEISQMLGTLPHLATKADLAKRPTIAGIIAIVALIAAIASVPIWPQGAAAIRTVAAAGR